VGGAVEWLGHGKLSTWRSSGEVLRWWKMKCGLTQAQYGEARGYGGGSRDRAAMAKTD
jgi:hypothetical protein